MYVAVVSSWEFWKTASGMKIRSDAIDDGFSNCR
jgi:hypothetical protein